MTLVRVYGRLIGQGSLAVVTRGFTEAFRTAGVLAGVYGVDSDVPEELEPIEGSDARHGVYVGLLDRVGKMFERGRHAHYWIMVTPNSDQLPRDLVKQLKRYQLDCPSTEDSGVHFMAPSQWAVKVVARHLGNCMPGSIPHGVSPEYVPNITYAVETRALFEAGTFRVVHFSTSARARKGTLELLKAWQLLHGAGSSAEHFHAAYLRAAGIPTSWEDAPGKAELVCVMDYAAKAALEEAIADGEIENWSILKETVRLVDRVELPPAAMAQNLCRAHVVCQPSRGEGFGLIPLQALCCGVPIVVTEVTGHTEYVRRDNYGFYPAASVLVRTGEDAPIDDLPGSIAPSLDPIEIAGALLYARYIWIDLHRSAQAGASDWRAKWSWDASLGPFIRCLKNT